MNKMNEEQKKIYDEWKRLEEVNHIDAKIIKKGESYGPVKSIKFDDWDKLVLIRIKVWDELRQFLNIDERAELGKTLNKTVREIFDTDKYYNKLYE